MALHVPHGHKQPAVLCILEANDRYLLLRRDRPPNQGMIIPVGGKIDAHETARAAAIREVLEETGIEIESVFYRGVLIESSPCDYNWICFVYTAEIDFCDPPPCPEGTLMWVDSAELASVPTPRTDAFIYRAVARGETFALESVYDENLELVQLRDEIGDEILFARD